MIALEVVLAAFGILVTVVIFIFSSYVGSQRAINGKMQRLRDDLEAEWEESKRDRESIRTTLASISLRLRADEDGEYVHRTTGATFAKGEYDALLTWGKHLREFLGEHGLPGAPTYHGPDPEDYARGLEGRMIPEGRNG